MAVDSKRLITTEFVLVEIADGLAAVRFRAQAVQVIATLKASPWVEIVSASSRLFNAALELYKSRGDKDWGLTDCASFIVMSERGLLAALTTDDHFRQAGFRALLLENIAGKLC
jgi:predicted nucleic acid-binding protein